MQRATYIFLLIVLLAVLGGAAVAAQRTATTDEYQLRRSVIGGAASPVLSGEGYRMTTTLGEPATGQSSGDGYTVDGGYEAPSEPVDTGSDIFLPLTVRGGT